MTSKAVSSLSSTGWNIKPVKRKNKRQRTKKKEPQSEQIGDTSPYIINKEPWNPLPWWKISKSEPSKPACRKPQSNIHIGYPVGMPDVGWRPLGIHSESKPTWCDFIELSFFLSNAADIWPPVASSSFMSFFQRTTSGHALCLVLVCPLRGSSTGVFKFCSLVSSCLKLFGSNRMLIVPIEASNMCIVVLWFS